MEDLFEVLTVIIIAIVGAALKGGNKKTKKAADKPTSKSTPQVAMGQTAPVQPAQPVVVPLEALTASGDHRQNIEKAIAAFSDLLDAKEKQPDHKPSGSMAREQTSIEAETAMKQRAELIQARVQESLSGESMVDDHGCIGGSMPEHTAEGETLAEHAVHEQNRAERLQTETAAVRAEDLRKPTAADLRKAIIMSEILDKPVSMRRRRI